MKNTMNKTRILKIALVLCICLFSVLYCLVYVKYTGPLEESYSPDEGNYIAMARRLINDGVYSFWGEGPDAYVSPGFPLFLVVCMKIFGTDVYGILAIKIVQSLLTAGTVFLTFIFGYQLTKKYAVGVIAAVLIALNGSFCFLSRFLLTETLYYFTMMLFFVVLVYSFKKDKWWLHLISGVLLCVSVMVRPLIIIVAPFVYLPYIIEHRKNLRKAALCVLAFAGGFVILAMPWWIRNIVTLDRFVFLATQTNPIYAGLAPDVAALGLTDPGSMIGNIKLLFKLLSDDFLGTVYWMTFGKFEIMFMNCTDVRVLEVLTAMLSQITVYVGLLGALLTLKLKKYRWTSIVFFVYFASSFMFVPTGRYGLQYLPFLAIFTGFVAVTLWNSIGKKKSA